MSWIDNSETSACLLFSEKIRSGSSREDKKFNYCDDHVIHSVDATKQSVIHNKEQNNGDFSTAISMKKAISTRHDPKNYLDECHLNTFSWQRRKRRTFNTKFKQDCFNVVIRSVYALSLSFSNVSMDSSVAAIELSSFSITKFSNSSSSNGCTSSSGYTQHEPNMKPSIHIPRCLPFVLRHCHTNIHSPC